jgi:hypothetical protein
MKNIFKFLVLICMSFAVWSCTNQDIVVHYPASTPTFDTAKVTESQITYGDSIHVRIAVSDKVQPLSTLLLKVVCNNEIIVSETFRTKGNSTNISRTYGVPFVANRPDNSPVKVYLTLTNVEGFTKDSIVSTTIAKRPVISDLYLVPDFGTGLPAKLVLTDPINLIYKVTGLTYSTSINYKIATKLLPPFKRTIDWTGLVFGKVGSGLGLINVSGESANVTDATLVGISEFTFDALKFTIKVGGKLLEPVTTFDPTTDIILNPTTLLGTLAASFRGGNIYFGEGVEVTFSNMTNLANNLSPDYFQVTGTNTAKFLGKTGLYKAYYYLPSGYLYIEPQPDVLYPDALWICGVGFGRPQTPYSVTASADLNPQTNWKWDVPLEYAPCRLVSPGVYQVTVYCENNATTDANGIGSLNFKFFDKRGWWDGHEEWSTNYTVSAPLAPSEYSGNLGNTIGLSSAPFSGVYRITLNQNDKTIKAVKLN